MTREGALNTPVAASVEGASARRALKTLITEQVRPLLEQRALRLTVIGMLLIVASAFSLVPAPTEVDSGWLFIVPVAIAAIAAGLKEGLFVALVSSARRAWNEKDGPDSSSRSTGSDASGANTPT